MRSAALSAYVPSKSESAVIVTRSIDRKSVLRRPELAHAVEALQCEAEGVDRRVATGAGGIECVRLESCARRLGRVGGREAHDDAERARIFSLETRNPAHDRDTPEHGVAAVVGREHREKRALVQDAEAAGAGKRRALSGACGREAVDRREGLFRDRPVGSEKLRERAARAMQDLVDERAALVLHRLAGAGKLGVDALRLFAVRDLFDSEPLADDVHEPLLAGRGRK